MNQHTVRGIAIGVGAGIAAGAVVLGGLVAVVEYELPDKVRDGIARRRLAPGDRAELDRLRAARTAGRLAATRTDRERHARIRAKYAPQLLATEHRRHSLQSLPVPALIAEIEAASVICQDPTSAWQDHNTWWDHRAALFDEFERRRRWDVKCDLPELDRLRLDAAEHLISLRYTAAMPANRLAPVTTDRTANEE
ncbi:hypothetical protein H0264_18740 [Nocardia huaxiensis]|uniref:Uncharacterized protein n=1 Tax=Nocardia huaxiensis TaxID=2755382 RepID=A0A7D6ZHW5_9NOCA|nr:hypothetical protein [Nocardia huaxiensis]QLY33998.1 hypothetical protein H0264_18740 [Nocardia huaxiensis]